MVDWTSQKELALDGGTRYTRCEVAGVFRTHEER